MLTKILNRLTGSVIFEIECSLEADRDRLGFAVKAAIAAKADLRSADLRSADLSSANLRYADLSYADLSSANLRYANLRYANLRYANLRYANLRSADLRYADLSYADLSSANLRYADLSYADLSSAKGITDDFPLPEGITLGEFKREIVPHLLTAGGKAMTDVLGTGCWDCHSWENCPMHVALGISDAAQAPVVLRPWVTRFVQLFDAKLLEKPAVEVSAG